MHVFACLCACVQTWQEANAMINSCNRWVTRLGAYTNRFIVQVSFSLTESRIGTLSRLTSAHVINLPITNCTDCTAALNVSYECRTIATTDLSLHTIAPQQIPSTFPLLSAPPLEGGVENDTQSPSSMETVNCDCYISQARFFPWWRNLISQRI